MLPPVAWSSSSPPAVAPGDNGSIATPGNSVSPAGSGSPSIRFPPGQVPGHATVVRVDAASGAIEAVVPVGPDPLLLAIASRRVWTLNLGDGTLSRVEPSSNRATSIIPGVVVGFTSDGRDLWVARDGNVLSRVDGVTGEEKSSFILGPRPLFALRDAGFLGVGHGSVWLTVPKVGEPTQPHTLWRLDPKTGEVLAKFPLGRDVLPPLVDARYVWIIAMGEQTVTRLDPRSGEAVEAPNPGLPLALAEVAGSLWVGAETSEVWRIDPDGLEVEAKIPIEGVLRGIGSGDGLVWVTTESDLLAIDPATDQVALSVPMGYFPSDTGPRGIGLKGAFIQISGRDQRVSFKAGSVCTEAEGELGTPRDPTRGFRVYARPERRSRKGWPRPRRAA
jgi:hypothetical protein